MNVQRSGIINFDSIEERDVWLNENFPVNMERIEKLRSAIAKNHAVIIQPHEKRFFPVADLYPGVKMNLKKEALRDAEVYAQAQMFFGEGAGTERKLIKATVEHKAATFPGYKEAFQKALMKQDMAHHAKSAQKRRRKIDTSKKIHKNIKGVLNGDYRSVNLSVMAIVVGGYYAHQTGLDRVVLETSKRKYRELKRKYKMRKNNITTL